MRGEACFVLWSGMKSIIVLLAIFALSVSADPKDVWFGTSTSKNGASKGIYHATFDATKGKLGAATLVAEVGSPGFLAMHPDGTRLYAACRTEKGPAVAGYTIGAQGALTLINSQAIGDGGAAHLAVHPSGKMVVSVQYGGGSTAVFPLSEDGTLGERSQLLEHEGGSKVVERRQDRSHAHYVGFDASGRFAFVPDLGLDGVVIYRVTGDGSGLEKHGFAACPPGGGPRHMKLFGDYAYVLNELALSVTTFLYDGKGGMVSQATVPALSDDVKAQEVFNAASEIVVHPSGKFVFSANRGHDSITVYRADEGKLTVEEVESIRGAWPRNFNLDPSGKWLLAAGQHSSTVSIFAIDQETGRLTFQMNSTVQVPTPICILFGN
jgi:6-phosphogluconolactonase